MNRFRKVPQKVVKSESERASPLREFSHDAQHKSFSKRMHRFNLMAYWVLPVLVFVVIIAAGVFIALSFTAKNEVAKEEAGQPAFSTSRSDISVPELLEAYIDAIGGRAALGKVRSVRYEGQVKFSKGVNDFQMLLLLPDKGMLVTNPGEAGSLKLMLNGDIAWQVVEKQDGTREVLALDEEGTNSLKWSLKVHNSFRSLAMQAQFEGFTARQIQFEGKPCYELTKTMPDGSDFTAVLEEETLYLLKTQETVKRKDGVDEFSVLYDDHSMVSGVVEPYRTSLYRNGELDNEVEIDSIRMNTGVMSSLFEIPKQFQQ